MIIDSDIKSPQEVLRNTINKSAKRLQYLMDKTRLPKTSRDPGKEAVITEWLGFKVEVSSRVETAGRTTNQKVGMTSDDEGDNDRMVPVLQQVVQRGQAANIVVDDCIVHFGNHSINLQDPYSWDIGIIQFVEQANQHWQEMQPKHPVKEDETRVEAIFRLENEFYHTQSRGGRLPELPQEAGGWDDESSENPVSSSTVEAGVVNELPGEWVHFSYSAGEHLKTDDIWDMRKLTHVAFITGWKDDQRLDEQLMRFIEWQLTKKQDAWYAKIGGFTVETVDW